MIKPIKFVPEVGARGFVAHSTRRWLFRLGLGNQKISRLCKGLSEVVARFSYSIYLARSDVSWDRTKLLLSPSKSLSHTLPTIPPSSTPCPSSIPPPSLTSSIPPPSLTSTQSCLPSLPSESNSLTVSHEARGSARIRTARELSLRFKSHSRSSQVSKVSCDEIPDL